MASIDWSQIEIHENEYQDEYIGKYLKKKLKKLTPEHLFLESGTLKTYYKIKLANLLKEDISWHNMSKDAQNLTKKVVEFIKLNNYKIR
ncbi:MAG: hypothetical protein IPI65_16805 [Bacteroidetes bacterium]|nr:hypothetical protein [Bacteroidota bacterium]